MLCNENHEKVTVTNKVIRNIMLKKKKKKARYFIFWIVVTIETNKIL